jgi:Domain of unknown function (DUF4145)
MPSWSWANIGNIESQSYMCWSCGQPLASDKGWQANDPNTGQPEAYICICHRCKKPTLVELSGKQTPGVQFGNPVKDISDTRVSSLYDEARIATGVGAYTAAVLACRKLLMHIAVSKGAQAGDSFLKYVEYLAANHFIPPDAKDWVDHIRQKGNEANHEINIMAKDDAEELIVFSEMLLKLVFEFPAAIKRKTGSLP